MHGLKSLVLLGLLSACLADKHSGKDDSTALTEQLKQFSLDQNIQTLTIGLVRDGRIIFTKQLDTDRVRSGNKEKYVDMMIDPLDRHITNGASLDQIKEHKPHGALPALDLNHLLATLSILTLQRDGKIQLNNPVFGQNGILPTRTNFPDSRVNEIQVAHLLQQTVGWGVRDMKWSENVENTDEDWSKQSMNSVLARVLQKRMMWQPGAAFNFSVTNEYLIRQIVERISGDDYATYVSNEILKPLNLHHTEFKEDESSKKDYTMPLLGRLWRLNIHDILKLLMATDGDENPLSVDLRVLYSRPGPPYPPNTRHWHSPTYFLNKQGAFWGECTTGNGHYMFTYHSGTHLTRALAGKTAENPGHETLLVLYAHASTHRHFKPLLLDMMKHMNWIE